MLAFVMAVLDLKRFLIAKKFLAVTDHKPLIWLKNHPDPSPRLARWLVILREFDFDMEYREGAKIGNVATNVVSFRSLCFIK